MDRTVRVADHTYFSENSSTKLSLEVLIIDPWPQVIVQSSPIVTKLLSRYTAIKLAVVSGSHNLDKSLTYSTSDICKSGRVRYHSPIHGIEVHKYTYDTLVKLMMNSESLIEKPNWCHFVSMYIRSFDDELTYTLPYDMILLNALSKDVV